MHGVGCGGEASSIPSGEGAGPARWDVCLRTHAGFVDCGRSVFGREVAVVDGAGAPRLAAQEGENSPAPDSATVLARHRSTRLEAEPPGQAARTSKGNLLTLTITHGFRCSTESWLATAISR
jgi:hypothetical protein